MAGRFPQVLAASKRNACPQFGNNIDLMSGWRLF
jgi:hypothetical protein